MIKSLTKGLTKEEKSWMLYDWANQGYVMIVMTVIFVLYFQYAATTAFGGGEEAAARATSIWGFTNTAATVVVGLLAPILGTLSGYKGIKKLLFVFLAWVGIIGTLALAIVPQQWWFMLLLVFVIASIGFNGGNKIYDAFLVDVCKKENMNRVSTLGFGFAYIGGAIPFILSMPFVVLVEMGRINMSLVTAYRISFWIAGIWWIVFSIPMFKNVKQTIGIEMEPHFIRKSFAHIWATFLDLAGLQGLKFTRASLLDAYKNRKNRPPNPQKHILVFLIAFFLYSDGLGSIIRLAVSYGEAIGLSPIMLMAVLLVTQFVAFPCAIIYGKMAERIGAKNMIYFGIGTYCVVCAIALAMNPARDIRFLTAMFWALAMLVGTAQGGIQALSRSYFGRIIPKEKSNEYFGFYNVFGRFASVLGTTFYGIVSFATGQPHYGIAIIVVLFVAAAVIFRYVPDDRTLATDSGLS